MEIERALKGHQFIYPLKIILLNKVSNYYNYYLFIYIRSQKILIFVTDNFVEDNDQEFIYLL